MQNPAQARGTLPLVVGVTGHRDIRLADVARLEAEVEDIFRSLARDYPATPLIVLSALADGADRLVARVGLRAGARLIAPMPVPLEDYLSDFADPASLSEFRALCGQAAAMFAVPFTDPDHPRSGKLTGAARDRRYAAAGAYLAVNSDVLIALWNGEPPSRVGGTACIVAYKLNGVPPPYGPAPSPLDVAESGPVYHIITPRTRDESAPPHALELRMKYPRYWKTTRDAAAFYARLYHRIDTFNADCVKASLVPGEPADTSPAQLHALADSAAIVYQRRALGSLLNIFWIVGISVAAFEVYAHLGGGTWFLACEVAGFMVATLIFVYARRQRYQEKYQDYRALAEGLRVLINWRLAGITDSVADYYLRKQKSELDWIRDAIRSCRVLADADAACKPEGRSLPSRMRIVYESWIVSQRDWFSRTAKNEDRKAQRFDRLSMLLFAGGLFVAFFVVVALLVSGRSLEEVAHDRFVAALALSTVAAGLLHNYSEKRAWLAHVKQYRRMQLIFTQAAENVAPHLDAPVESDLESARRIFHDLGREALIENGDWLLLHRERPIDVPGA
jgi:hypothetical protein